MHLSTGKVSFVVANCLVAILSGCSQLQNATKDFQVAQKQGEGFIQQLKDHEFKPAEQYLTTDAQKKWNPISGTLKKSHWPKG